MKKILILLMLVLMNVAFPVEEKVYTEKDFNKKVKEEVLKRLSEVKKKSVVDLTKEILEKEEKLQAREEKIIKREEQLFMSEKNISNKAKKIEAEQRKILGCIDQNSESFSKRVQQLVGVVSNMKPDKAAQLLSVQESEISVKILSKLESKKASRIFNLMEKEVSARLQKEFLHMRQ